MPAITRAPSHHTSNLCCCKNKRIIKRKVIIMPCLKLVPKHINAFSSSPVTLLLIHEKNKMNRPAKKSKVLA